MTPQQTHDFFKSNELTSQSFVQFHCNTEGLIKFLTTFMTSDPDAIIAIQQFFPFFNFSLETAFLLKRENLTHLPGIQEIHIHKILTVLDQTRDLLQQVQSLSQVQSALLPGKVPVSNFTKDDLILPPELNPQTRLHVEGITSTSEQDMIMRIVAPWNPSMVQRPHETMFIIFKDSTSARNALSNINLLCPTKKAFVETRKQLLKLTENGKMMLRDFQNFEQKINEFLIPHGTKLSIKKSRKTEVRLYFDVPDGSDELALLETVCRAIVCLFNNENCLTSKLAEDHVEETGVEPVVSESFQLGSKISTFVQRRCKFDLLNIEQSTKVSFQFGDGDILTITGPQSNVILAKEELSTLEKSIGTETYPRPSSPRGIEIRKRASYFLILNMLKLHKTKIIYVADVKSASFEIIARQKDLEFIDREITKITDSVLIEHIVFSEDDLQVWTNLIAQTSGGLTGVYKLINSNCSVAMKFREEAGCLDIAGNRETIEQAKTIIGNLINGSKIQLRFPPFSPTPQRSVRA